MNADPDLAFHFDPNTAFQIDADPVQIRIRAGSCSATPVIKQGFYMKIWIRHCMKVRSFATLLQVKPGPKQQRH
jgi:hypothetical protein